MSARVEDYQHHAGVYQDERAHTQEGHRVGQVADKHVEQFEEVLHDEIAHAAVQVRFVPADQGAENLTEEDNHGRYGNQANQPAGVEQGKRHAVAQQDGGQHARLHR